MPGIGKCIADVLRNDIVSVPASTYVTLYPTLFNAASAVPTYVYTCLKDIWLQNTTASGNTPFQWSADVIDLFGLGSDGTKTVSVCTNRTVDQINGPRDMGPKSNNAGAKYSEIFIYLKIGQNLSQADSDRVYQAALRIEKLIDYDYRTNVLGQKEIPISATSINNQADLKLYWDGSLNRTSREAFLRYHAFYSVWAV